MDDLILEPTEVVEETTEVFEFDMPKSRVYILCDDDNRVTRIEGEYSLPTDLTDWILIDEGYGDKYNLAQSHYLDKPLVNDNGTHNYKYVDNVLSETTDEDKETELESFPIPETEPDPLLELYEIEADQEERICLLEMGMTTDDFTTEEEI